MNDREIPTGPKKEFFDKLGNAMRNHQEFDLEFVLNDLSEFHCDDIPPEERAELQQLLREWRILCQQTYACPPDWWLRNWDKERQG